ncbi:MAG: class I SAM-dependent methyltransferase [Clostridia bacterium]|nr:class I SAM-dependent methyltransferase [Clostridia bacterium]
MLIADKWDKTEYILLDASDGERLESWNGYTVIRPDPQVIWKNVRRNAGWKRPDASYKRSSSGGGSWSGGNRLPEEWEMTYSPLGLRFVIRPMGFKHMGIFPEQAVNWDWFTPLRKNAVEAGREIKVLNLFAYTGGATAAAAKAGAAVVHVDASKGMTSLAKRNAELCGLADAPIRYRVDDCRKFVEREIRRGNRYDAIIMDPPSYGRGPNKEIWKLEDSISEFVSLTAQVLSDDPIFFLLNSYTTGLSPAATEYILRLNLPDGVFSSAELGLPVKQTGFALPCGSAARWQKQL